MARNDIRNFLLVIGSGVLIACLAVFWMLSIGGYEKGMYVREVLLSPDTMEVMSNRAVRVGGKEFARYLVESVDYSYFDGRSGKWEMVALDIKPYTALWNEIEGDRGSMDVEQDVLKLFDDSKISTLAIYVRREIGDWYRLQMHDSDEKGGWIYFYHPGIQSQILGFLKSNG
jgi:hypothetical protein